MCLYVEALPWYKPNWCILVIHDHKVLKHSESAPVLIIIFSSIH